MRHIGLYAYRAGALRRLAQTQPCALEDIEKLEQLRALWSGLRIRVERAKARPGRGVDTEADLSRAADQIGGAQCIPPHSR
jgi:3-deoxy-manno-octulosonate cytidylyltransferase (CMP-KDO synthetase)